MPRRILLRGAGGERHGLPRGILLPRRHRIADRLPVPERHLQCGGLPGRGGLLLGLLAWLVLPRDRRHWPLESFGTLCCRPLLRRQRRFAQPRQRKRCHGVRRRHVHPPRRRAPQRYLPSRALLSAGLQRSHALSKRHVQQRDGPRPGDGLRRMPRRLLLSERGDDLGDELPVPVRFLLPWRGRHPDPPVLRRALLPRADGGAPRVRARPVLSIDGRVPLRPVPGGAVLRQRERHHPRRNLRKGCLLPERHDISKRAPVPGRDI